MNTNITRDDISNFINSEFGLTKKDCNDIVNHIIEEIIIGLKKDKIVKIHNFGTFKIITYYIEYIFTIIFYSIYIKIITFFNIIFIP